jgi:hypothetical protein
MTDNIMKNLILCLLFTLPLSARNYPHVSPEQGSESAGTFSFYAGGTTSLMIHRSFGKFVDSYNDYNGKSGIDILEDDLKNFRLAYGYRMGARAMLPMGIGFAVNYEQLFSHTSVGIKTGYKRHFRHITRTPTLGFVFEKEKLRMQFNIGFCFPVIESSYEYPDGTISTGKERNLNGIYQGFSACGNIEVAYKIGLGTHLSLEAGAQLTMYSMGYYEEGNWDRSNYYISNYGFVYPLRLPTDYASYASTSWDRYDDSKAVKSSAIMPGLFVQLAYTL